MKYIKFLSILILVTISLISKSQIQNDSVGVYKSTTFYTLDSINNLSDSLILHKYLYKNDTSLGYFIGYNSLGIKIARIDFRQNQNYQVALFNKKGQMIEMILIINDSIEEHLKFSGRSKLFEKVRLHISGIKISETLYYNNGNIIYLQIFDPIGKLIIEKKYFRNGQLMYIFLYKNEVVIESQFYNRKGEIRK